MKCKFTSLLLPVQKSIDKFSAVIQIFVLSLHQAFLKKENREPHLGEKKQDVGNEPRTQKKVDIAKMPPIDIRNLDLEQMQPVGRDEYELGGMKVCFAAFELLQL